MTKPSYEERWITKHSGSPQIADSAAGDKSSSRAKEIRKGRAMRVSNDIALAYAHGVQQMWDEVKEILRPLQSPPMTAIADAARDLMEKRATESFVELRPDGDDYPDSLDEVIAANVLCVHVERMDDNAYWMGLDLADGRHVRVSFGTPRATIKVRAEIERG